MYKLLFIDDESIYKLTIRGLVDWEKYGFLFAGTAPVPLPIWGMFPV